MNEYLIIRTYTSHELIEAVSQEQADDMAMNNPDNSDELHLDSECTIVEPYIINPVSA